MKDEHQSRYVRAAWVIQPGHTPLRDAVLTIRGNRIDALEKYRSEKHAACNVADLGDVILLPGFVNAHTHLEFSHLQHPLGSQGIAFTDWVKLVIAERVDHQTKEAAIQQGLQESESCGSAAIGEICTGNSDGIEQPYRRSRGCLFYERLGNHSATHLDIVQQAHQFLNGARAEKYERGISPHAPYSVPLSLLEKLVQVASNKGVPIAMHLAETQEEVEYLENGQGAFKGLLEELGALDPETQPYQLGVYDYLEVLRQLQRCLVIHGNYLNIREIEFIAERDSFSVVYCPRTHAFFGHAEYPLETLLDRGINVAVGTDSRASNPDLSIWSELRAIAHSFPQLDPATILKMGTVNGAKALGLEKDLGEIRENRLAKFVAVHVGRTKDPLAAIFDQAEALPVAIADLDSPNSGASDR